MSAVVNDRGFWPSVLTALVEQHPGKSTMELTRLFAPELTGKALERKRKAVHQALCRLLPSGGIGCSVGVEWVRYKRTMVCRWYPSGVDVPAPVTARSQVLEAVKRLGRATPSSIHLSTKLSYSNLYRTCHALAAEGLLVNVAPAPLQCWVLPDGDLTPFEVPAHYRVPPHKRPGYQPPPKVEKPKAAPVAAVAATKLEEPQQPYINPIRARALGLTVGAQQG